MTLHVKFDIENENKNKKNSVTTSGLNFPRENLDHGKSERKQKNGKLKGKCFSHRKFGEKFI